MGWWRNVRHPERYHGHGTSPPFFEGWYYKLVDAGEQHRYAIIPGIQLSDDPDKQHAFIQVFDGVSGRMTYHRYPADAFSAVHDRFQVQIGPNQFFGDSIALQVDSPERRVAGQVRFAEPVPWPSTLLSPGIMGPFSWVPFMETYHGVVSLDHGLAGTLTIDGQEVTWDGGRGYIEKDWGASFPAAWVWFQTNHFAEEGTSLTASVAIIPWLGWSFRGFIIGLWHQGRLYRFATYTGAQTEHLAVHDDRVEWVVSDRRHRLEMRAVRAEVGLLRGPTRADMGLRVPETLSAHVEVRFVERSHPRQPLFEGTGRYAGLEVAGDIERLVAM